jgi:disulfide bond formation protein DsbB
MTAFFRTYGLYFAWLLAVIASLGSLAFSELLLYVPCKLCWLQRIFMYPLAIQLGIASYRSDRNAIVYALPLSIVGGLIAAYHVLLQLFPSLESITPCRGGISCSQDYINWLGFITIPMLSLTAFTLNTAMLLLTRRADKLR